MTTDNVTIQRLTEHLKDLHHAFGAFTNTPKANRCMPTQRECNQFQGWAMRRAAALLRELEEAK